MKIINELRNNDVTCLEAAVNYTIFHLSDGNKMISSYTLKRYAEMPQFALFKRLNRKQLINPEFILHYKKEKNVSYAVLQNGQEVRVSRRRSV